MRHAFTRVALGPLLVIGLASPAAAFPILVTFSGSVNQVDPNLTSVFTNGDAVSGSYQYESTTADVQSADPLFAVYSSAPSNASFQFGSYAATGATGSILIDIDPSHSFSASIGTVTGASVGAFALTGLSMTLIDSTSTVFADDSLPTSLDPNDFTLVRASLAFSDGTNSAFVLANLTSLTTTALPEPAAASLLLAAGLAALGLRPRARRARG